MGKWIVGAICVLVLIGATGSITRSFREHDQPAAISAAWECATLIRNFARDPDSVQFISDPDSTPAKPIGNGNWSSALLVRAANGFGGKNVEKILCKVYRDDHGNWRGKPPMSIP